LTTGVGAGLCGVEDESGGVVVVLGDESGVLKTDGTEDAKARRGEVDAVGGWSRGGGVVIGARVWVWTGELLGVVVTGGPGGGGGHREGLELIDDRAEAEAECVGFQADLAFVLDVLGGGVDEEAEFHGGACVAGCVGQPRFAASEAAAGGSDD